MALKEPPLEDDTFDEALKYRRAIDYIELLSSNVDHPDERHTMLTGKEQVYGAMIALCLSFRDHGWQALEFTQRARMRSFLDALGSSRAEQLESADPAAAGWSGQPSAPAAASSAASSACHGGADG